MQLLATLDFNLLPWGLWCAAVALIAWRWPALRGTTLVAPALWSILAMLVMAIAEDLETPAVDGPAPSWRLPLRYFTGVTSLCPAIALFGAKRPQNRAWQFIVVTLWTVLSLPSVHWWLAGRGESFGIHVAQEWFLAILLLMTGVNYLPTRFAIASLLISVAQFLLLQTFLPFSSITPQAELKSLVLCFGALVFVIVRSPRRRMAREPLDRLWLDFRDAFGAVWGLRVQQRVNQSAAMYGWKLRLDWHSFTPLEGQTIPPEIRKSLQDNLANLLRRFVSPAWIAERLTADVN